MKIEYPSVESHQRIGERCGRFAKTTCGKQKEKDFFFSS